MKKSEERRAQNPTNITHQQIKVKKKRAENDSLLLSFRTLSLKDKSYFFYVNIFILGSLKKPPLEVLFKLWCVDCKPELESWNQIWIGPGVKPFIKMMEWVEIWLRPKMNLLKINFNWTMWIVVRYEFGLKMKSILWTQIENLKWQNE